MSTVEKQALEVAVDAARGAGRLARTTFDAGVASRPKGDGVDVVTDTDGSAEELIVSHIHEIFPDHGILAEERGAENDSAEWQWIIDPLDGTNNFAIGLPLYGVCIALLRKGEPVLSVLHDSHNDTTVWAQPGNGVHRMRGNTEAERIRATWSVEDVKRANVSLVVGYDTAKTGAGRAVGEVIATNVKRRHSTWAPCVDWMLLASGGMDAVVLMGNESWDAIPGLLIAQEAGAVLRTFDGKPWTEWDSLTVNAIAGSPVLVDNLVKIVSAAVTETKL